MSPCLINCWDRSFSLLLLPVLLFRQSSCYLLCVRDVNVSCVDCCISRRKELSEAVGEGVKEEKSFRTLKTEGETNGLCCARRGFILGVVVAQDAVGLNAGNGRSWQTPGCHQQMERIPVGIQHQQQEFGLKSHFCPGTGAPVPSPSWRRWLSGEESSRGFRYRYGDKCLLCGGCDTFDASWNPLMVLIPVPPG